MVWANSAATLCHGVGTFSSRTEMQPRAKPWRKPMALTKAVARRRAHHNHALGLPVGKDPALVAADSA